MKEIIDLCNNSGEKLPKYFACLKLSLLGGGIIKMLHVKSHSAKIMC